MKSLRLLLATLLLAASGLHAAVAEADFAKIAALTQANKDAEARALFAELLKASPNDPQLLTLAKQFGGSADKSRAITLDDLRGPVRIQYAAAEKILRDAMQDQLAEAERKASLLDYLGRTAALLSEYPGLSALWLKRAGVALELNFPAVAREAGVKLVALGAADSGDTRTLEILGELEIKRWLKPAPAGTAPEAGAAFTVGQAARLGEFTVEKEALAALLTDGSRSTSEKQSAWESFLRKWSIRDDGGPADAGRVRYAEQGPALAENEAMRRQAEERRVAEERQREETARNAAATEATRAAAVLEAQRIATASDVARVEQQRLDSRPKEGRNFVLQSPVIDLIWIAPGTFRMGSENGRDNEKPSRKVTHSAGYWLGKTEVTQIQWQAVMGENPSAFKGEVLPVECVSWDNAMAFCQRVNKQEHAAGRLPDGFIYTLPTEAQWEYACRAGTSGDNAGVLGQLAWNKSNSSDVTHNVGTKQPNAWGLYDMQGNVQEWCGDWYDGDYSGNASGSSIKNPTGPTVGTHRVVRGGCWWDDAVNCRSAYRSGFVPGYRMGDLGFRLALSSVRSNSQ